MGKVKRVNKPATPQAEVDMQQKMSKTISDLSGPLKELLAPSVKRGQLIIWSHALNAATFDLDTFRELKKVSN